MPGSIASVPTGELKFSWGSPGHGPGQFDTVHSIFIDHDDGDRLYVADRFNNRIQFFGLDGTYLGEWGGLRLPQSVRKGPDGSFFVAELSHRITVLDATGAVVSRWGDDVAVDDADGGTAAALPDAPSRKETIMRPGPQRSGTGVVLRAARDRGRFAGQLLRRRGVGIVGRSRSREQERPEVRPEVTTTTTRVRL